MGREIVEAVPAAMEVFRAGSEASGMDLMKLCFDTPLAEMVRDGEPAAGARRDVPRDQRGDPRARDRAGLRRRPFRRRVLRARRRTLAVAGRGDRARARARAGDGRGREGKPRDDGGDPRPRRRGRREHLQEDPQRVAGELQLPRPDRHLRRERGRGRVLRPGGGRRRAPRDQASRLGRVPFPARRARGGAAEAGDRARELRRAAGAVHVDGDREAREARSGTARCSSSS